MYGELIGLLKEEKKDPVPHPSITTSWQLYNMVGNFWKNCRAVFRAVVTHNFYYDENGEYIIRKNEQNMKCFLIFQLNMTSQERSDV